MWIYNSPLGQFATITATSVAKNDSMHQLTSRNYEVQIIRENSKINLHINQYTIPYLLNCLLNLTFICGNECNDPDAADYGNAE